MNEKEFVSKRTKIITKMLDNPDKYGIYPTTKCFKELDNLFREITKTRIEKIKLQAIINKINSNGNLTYGYKEDVIAVLEYLLGERKSLDGLDGL